MVIDKNEIYFCKIYRQSNIKLQRSATAMQHLNLQPTLENSRVILQPLQESDFEALYKVASDPEIWEQHPAKERSEREGFSKFFDDAMKTKTAFVIIDKETDEVIGSTRYSLSKELPNAIEIGWTFIAKKYWGTDYNKSIKALMIDYAFHYFDTILFYIDKNNFRSQKAVEKMGAQRISSLNGKTLEIRPQAACIYCLEKKA